MAQITFGTKVLIIVGIVLLLGIGIAFAINNDSFVKIMNVPKDLMQPLSKKASLESESYSNKTATTDTTCNNGKCELILYSGIRNVYEDDTWKRVEEARSLKGSGVECVINSDGTNKVKCLDWNTTWIDLEIERTDLISPTPINVPIKIYRLNDTCEDDKCEPYYISSETSVSLSSLNTKDTKPLNNFKYGDIIHIGETSTEVILQDADTENLDDGWGREFTRYISFGGNNEMLLLENTGGYDAEGAIRFNISAVPAGQQIDDASITLYINNNGLDASTEGYNLSMHRIYPFPIYNVSNGTFSEWNETLFTYDRVPVLGMEANATASDYIQFFGGVGEQTGYQTWNVQKIVEQEYEEGNNNVSIFIHTADIFGTPSSADDLDIDTKESSTAGYRPMLNITYSEAAAADESPTVTLDRPPQGESNSTTSFYFGVNVTDDINILNMTLKIWFANDSKLFNSTANISTDATSYNYTILVENFIVGNYTWNAEAYDNASQRAIAVANFSLNVTAVVADTCDCPAGDNWVVDCSDNCVIEAQCNIRDYNLTFYGTGRFTALMPIYVDRVSKPSTCEFVNYTSLIIN